jgi:microsomal dipeptidase-like Zn-dependent dipeptidase
MRNVVVKTVKGDRAAQRLVAKMNRRGYLLEQQSTRKVAWRFWLGPFTRQQKHTLTFIRATR